MNIKLQKIIDAYQNGESLNSIARTFHTYPTTIKRILEKNNVKLRHDIAKKGEFQVQNGEKLIEWAKSQKRLVTKAELAQVIGRKRLSPSYFEKYPELGQYIQPREQKDLKEYSQKLYNWLRENKISYKPNDRTRLQVSVNALLLEEYANIAIVINIKPKCVSKHDFERSMEEKLYRATKEDITILFLNEKHFEDLNCIKKLLNDLKHSKER